MTQAGGEGIAHDATVVTEERQLTRAELEGRRDEAKLIREGLEAGVAKLEVSLDEVRRQLDDAADVEGAAEDALVNFDKTEA